MGTLFRFIWQTLPTRGISWIMGRLGETSLSRRFIPWYARRFDVALDEAELPLEEYPTLAAFFRRRLKEGSRPIDPKAGSVVSPVDARVTAFGTIQEGDLLQVKGLDYSTADLLGTGLLPASELDHGVFEGGSYIILYLAPGDYHWIHSPLAGKVNRLDVLPGRLVTVSNRAISLIPDLLSRNERLVTWMETAAGITAVVKVGAANVGKIRVAFDPTVWTNVRGAWFDRGDVLRAWQGGMVRPGSRTEGEDR
jgi:phosphatidylserine decarboxylase